MHARPAHPPVTAHSRRSSTPAPRAEGIHGGVENRRPEAVARRKLAEFVRNSPRVVAQAKHEAALRGETAQRTGPEEEELLQGKFAPVQRKGPESDRAPRENKTGMADNLKSGIESLSGMSLDNVKVHYNSAQPAQLNALAYAQGSDIHVAPGQEQHLPHEAWHVVQQAQGRVKPTMQMKGGIPVNDDSGLEHEADVMGAKALRNAAQPREAHTEAQPQAKFGAVQLQPALGHAKGCGCPGCTRQIAATPPRLTVQAKLRGVRARVLQLTKCPYCGYENDHASNCTPQSRAAIAAARSAANKAAADQSQDNRTRKDQSHPKHGDKNVKKAWKK
jgi:hypothetical protein